MLLCGLLCLTLAGCSGLTGGASAGQGGGQGQVAGTAGGKDPGRAAKPKPTPTPRPTARPTPEPLELADVVGEDGRLTVLLLGSDKRKGIAGERTDTIIVATMEPRSGTVTMVSLPRDTVQVPIGPNKVYADRINTLFGQLQSQTDKRKAALGKLRQALSYAFGVQIDYAAMVDFDGVVSLVDRIGGVKVKLDEPLIDPSMHIGPKGLKLRAGRQTLDGREALAFSRSRHTSSDYDRSRRQQKLIAAAGATVRDQGVAALPSLLSLVRKKVVTDIPLAAAPLLLEMASQADLDHIRSIVLEPERYARLVPGGYTIAPRILEVRRVFTKYFDSIG
jgi:polyisoprenyl-teichoic acid--peptidoglycan teichoic acid transferase